MKQKTNNYWEGGVIKQPYQNPETKMVELSVKSTILDGSMNSNDIPGLDRPDLGDLWS
mgnify:CR=1 FL=1